MFLLFLFFFEELICRDCESGIHFPMLEQKDRFFFHSGHSESSSPRSPPYLTESAFILGLALYPQADLMLVN